MRSIWQWLVRHWEKLLALKDRPHVISRGVAIGTFFGFVPLFGLKTLLSIGLAWLVRGNVIAAAIAVTLHDVFLPIMPFILTLEYEVGYWVLSSPHHLPSLRELRHVHLEHAIDLTSVVSIGAPLMVGGSLAGLLFSIPAYIVTLLYLQKREQRRAKARAAGEAEI